MYNDVDQAVKDVNTLAEMYVEFTFSVDTEGPLNSAKIEIVNPLSNIVIAELEKALSFK